MFALPPLLWIAWRNGPVYWSLAAAALAGLVILEAVKPRDGVTLARALAGEMASVYARVGAAILRESRRDRWLAPSLALFASLTLGLQVTGGAYSAEFDGYPDEPAHLVSSLLVYDYITQWPHRNPMRWAEQYYLHYPKVAIGHWPPGYYLLQGFWWLFATPSRGSAMALNAILCVAAAAILYRLLRATSPGWLAAGAACLMIASPIVQTSFSLTMAELPCLLLATLFIATLARWIEKPSGPILLCIGLLLAATVLVKGTGVLLLLAPFLAAVMSGRGREFLNGKLVGAALAILALVLALYALGPAVIRTSLLRLEYIRLGTPHLVNAVGVMTGYGFGALAVGGIFTVWFWGKPGAGRNPEALASAAVLLSVAAASFFVREAVEPRHYILILPAVLLLAVESSRCLASRTRLAWLLLAAAAVWFPFERYRQTPSGFVELHRLIRLPTRMLVSSTASGEGAWIAEVALREKRPGSVVARATQILATMDWDGRDYRLITKTPQAVERRLDELGLDTVVVDSSSGGIARPDQTLLETTLRASPSWRPCARVDALEAFCRALPPETPRLPLQIDLRRSIGRTLTEQ
jgi:hypothetical protein